MNRTIRDVVILAAIGIVSTVVVWAAVGTQIIYENFDGPYYLVIAKCGYKPECIGRNFSFPLPLEYYPAHFPLYPAVINVVTMTGLSPMQAMVAINVAAGVGAALGLYQLFKENKWGNPVWAAAVWLFMWPRMWAVRSVGSPETLLMLFILGSAYYFIKRRYWLAAILGIGATLSKPPGILLLAGYGLWWLYEGVKNRRWQWPVWPVVLMVAALGGLFWLYQVQTGDFWAYFHSGDNIHLQVWPFKVFDSSQSWVGTFLFEDVLWIYLIGAVGVIRAFRKSRVLGWFGGVFFATILFVSHRDIARYSLPIVPVVLAGFGEIWERREVKWVMAGLLVPIFLYTVNFLVHNTAGVPTWQPFL